MFYLIKNINFKKGKLFISCEWYGGLSLKQYAKNVH